LLKTRKRSGSQELRLSLPPYIWLTCLQRLLPEFKTWPFEAFAIEIASYFVSLSQAASSSYRPISGLDTLLVNVAPYDTMVNPAMKIIMNAIST
jgi:hypothetical protein